MNQLVSVTHGIYASFDEGYKVRGGVFLDIPKAFDKVWREGLIFKLEQNGISGKLLRLIKDFSSWMDFQAGIPQGSIFSIIYINDLPNNLTSNPKLLADDTSLFSTVADPNVTSNHINNDLHNISTWAHQWKMHFNPDSCKQAQEVKFSRKVKVTTHLQLVFKNNPVHEAATQKHLEMSLDLKLNFQEHFENMLIKVNKTVRILRKLQNTFPRPSLLTIHKSFIRPHLDYGNIIDDQTYNASFQQKVESIQYHAALAITRAIRGTSKEKIFEELGLESLQHRPWYRELCCFYKILKD